MADKPSVTRNIVITAHRRRFSPRLDCICVKGVRCCRKGQFPRYGNLTFTAAILPRNGVAPWGRVCIFREGERGRGKNDNEGGGGCAKPLRGQAPVTPNSLILQSLHISSHYKLEKFVE